MMEVDQKTYATAPNSNVWDEIEKIIRAFIAANATTTTAATVKAKGTN